MEWHRIGTDDFLFSLVGRHNSQVVGGYETRLAQKAFGIKIGASLTEVTKKIWVSSQSYALSKYKLLATLY